MKLTVVEIVHLYTHTFLTVDLLFKCHLLSPATPTDTCILFHQAQLSTISLSAPVLSFHLSSFPHKFDNYFKIFAASSAFCFVLFCLNPCCWFLMGKQLHWMLWLQADVIWTLFFIYILFCLVWKRWTLWFELKYLKCVRLMHINCWGGGWWELSRIMCELKLGSFAVFSLCTCKVIFNHVGDMENKQRQ